MKKSSHPPHHYHNVIALILYMLPKIQEAILTKTYQVTDKAMIHLQNIQKLNTDDTKSAHSCHNFWDLIGYQ